MFQVCLTGLKSHRQRFCSADMCSPCRQVPVFLHTVFFLRKQTPANHPSALSVLLYQLCRWQMAACHRGLGWSPNPLGVSGCSSAAQQSQGGLAGNIWLLWLGLLSSAMGNLHPHVQGKQQEKENTCWVENIEGKKGETTTAQPCRRCSRTKICCCSPASSVAK